MLYTKSKILGSNNFKSWKFKILNFTGSEKIGRIILKCNKPQNLKIFKNFLKFLKNKASNYFSPKLNFLLFPAGFLKFQYQENIELDPHNNLKMNKENYNIAKEKIGEIFSESLKKHIKENLENVCDHIIIGIDLKFLNRNIQLALSYNLNNNIIEKIIGKIFPASREENKLLRFGNRYYDDHFQKVKNSKLLFLVCHDLNIYNNRGKVTSKKGGWRNNTRDEFTKLIEKNKPDIIFHLAHTSKKSTWSSAWNQLKKELHPKIYLSSFELENKKMKEKDIQHCLTKTKSGPVLDILCS